MVCYTVQAGNLLPMIDFYWVLMVQTGNLLPEIHVLCDIKQCSLVSCLYHFLPTHFRCMGYFCTWSHSMTQAVRLLCTRDRSFAETST